VEDQGDEYTWESTLDSDAGEGDAAKKQEIYKAVKSDLVKKVLPVLEKFRATLIDTHARDLGHEESASGGSGASTPAAAVPAAKPTAASSSASKPTTTKSGVTVSKETIELESRNACSQADLWDLMTNQARIPMWTRAPAQVSSRKLGDDPKERQDD
jgi:activator of HSP90 ATPase